MEEQKKTRLKTKVNDLISEYKNDLTILDFKKAAAVSQGFEIQGMAIQKEKDVLNKTINDLNNIL